MQIYASAFLRILITESRFVALRSPSVTELKISLAFAPVILHCFDVISSDSLPCDLDIAVVFEINFPSDEPKM